jgi:hypothetical protein
MSDGYIGDARIDELARISIGLMKEIWLLRDRQMVLERLLERGRVVDRQSMERDQPDASAEAEIRLEVDRMIARVFDGVFRASTPNLDDLRRRAADELALETMIRGG